MLPSYEIPSEVIMTYNNSIHFATPFGSKFYGRTLEENLNYNE